MKNNKPKLNLVNPNDIDVGLSEEQQTVIRALDGNTESLWKEAVANNQFLEGKEIQVNNGTMVDFSHFDLIVSITQFLPQDMTSDLKMLKCFWVSLYPFVRQLKAFAQHYQRIYREIAHDQNKTLKNYANQNLEIKCYKKFMDDRYPEMAEEFEAFHTEEKRKSDLEIERIKKVEERRMKKQEKHAVKVAEKNRQTTLGHNLSHHIKNRTPRIKPV